MTEPLPPEDNRLGRRLILQVAQGAVLRHLDQQAQTERFDTVPVGLGSGRSNCCNQRLRAGPLVAIATGAAGNRTATSQ